MASHPISSRACASSADLVCGLCAEYSALVFEGESCSPDLSGTQLSRGVLPNLIGNAILAQWTDPKPVDYVVTT